MLLQPHVSRRDLQERQAWAYRSLAARAPVTAILGAGNHAVLEPRDVLYKLFVEDRVAVLKAHRAKSQLTRLRRVLKRYRYRRVHGELLVLG